ncbi:MAG: hypothetical protein ABIJ09_20670 [Pseudomonadota bacterium]
MLDHLVELLTESEQTFFEALAHHRSERSASSRLALATAQAHLDAAKAEADRALWSTCPGARSPRVA